MLVLTFEFICGKFVQKGGIFMRKKFNIFISVLCFSILCCSFIYCFAGSSEGYKFNDISEEITTERLILTPINDEDIDILADYLLDYDVTKYLEFSTTISYKTKEEAINFFKKSSESGNAIEYTIKLKDTKLPIGTVSAMLYSDYNNLAELGYWLGKDFQGQGYASEACCSFSNKVFNSADVNSLYIACSVVNQHSANLAKKIMDYVEENNPSFELQKSDEIKTYDGIDGEVHVFTLKKAEAKSSSWLKNIWNNISSFFSKIFSSIFRK